jgi:RHS repeat-associated protein
MIAELDVPNSGAARVHRTYAWGLDASGTLTGAGGVGGLLLTSHHTPQADGGTQVTTLAPLYDFNGNVLVYADVATSTITHRMEYDPFGQELSLDTLLPGEGAAEAPRFRFSTKYTDGETGLVYYGYRSYSPELGRWVSRDPIEEKGGINLYGMVGNDLVNGLDVLGQFLFGKPITQVECDNHCRGHCRSFGSKIENKLADKLLLTPFVGGAGLAPEADVVSTAEDGGTAQAVDRATAAGQAAEVGSYRAMIPLAAEQTEGRWLRVAINTMP